MNAASIALYGASLLSQPSVSSGMGPDAQVLRAHVETVRSHLLESMSLRGLVEAAVEELEAARREASTENWDAYGARPVDERSYYAAIQFLTALPTTTPRPSVSIDPDGEVEVGWNISPRRVFTVSVGPTGRLAYAGLYGRNKTYGTEWLGAELPRPIIENLARVFGSW
jgi:hypothetical protein